MRAARTGGTLVVCVRHGWWDTCCVREARAGRTFVCVQHGRVGHLLCACNTDGWYMNSCRLLDKTCLKGTAGSFVTTASCLKKVPLALDGQSGTWFV